MGLCAAEADRGIVILAEKKSETPLPFADIKGLRGALRMEAQIAKNIWFQVGGVAECLFKPEDAEDLSLFLSHVPPEIPVTVIGVGSNLLVRDGGVKGVVIRLGRGFTSLSRCGDSMVSAGAACLDVHVAHFAAECGLAGLEFLSGVPGTIGGAVKMNAGAYGADICEALTACDIIERNGTLRTIMVEACGFSYRHSSLPEGAVVVSATLQGDPEAPDVIMARIKEIQAQREASQPIRAKTGGSTFKNPEGQKAWKLIDAAGCRGLRLGGAQVSEKHCNFLINTGSATAADLEQLGEDVRKRVLEHSGVMLEWEIKRVGEAL